MSKSAAQHTIKDLTFVGVSGAQLEVVTFGAQSSHDRERVNLVSLDTQTGAMHCDCKHCETHPNDPPRCWLSALVGEAWAAHPAMVEVRWLSLDQLRRYGKKLAAMVGTYRERTGRVLPADLINLAAARCEWRDRARKAAAVEAEAVAAERGAGGRAACVARLFVHTGATTMALTREGITAIPEAETTEIYDETVKEFLGQRAGIFKPKGSLADLILGVRTDLRRATDLLEKAICKRTEAVLHERGLLAQYADAKIAATARFHAGGLTGSNQAARDADLAVKLLADPDLRGLAKLVDGGTRRRIEAEGFERQSDIFHKALRVELAALGSLASN